MALLFENQLCFDAIFTFVVLSLKMEDQKTKEPK